MAGSQETFSKKELEKKRLKKRKEKEEKKEERKANAGKAQSLEEMFAYVDEDGNLTTTPPDQKKKKSIDASEINLDYSKPAAGPEELIRTGTVTFYNQTKGYGFIKDAITGESIFVHMNGLKEPVKENSRVTFETERTPKGKTALNVKLKK